MPVCGVALLCRHTKGETVSLALCLPHGATSVFTVTLSLFLTSESVRVEEILKTGGGAGR